MLAVLIFQGLRNLQTISLGGVSIFYNNHLCYIDLFRFDRIVVGAVCMLPVPGSYI